MGSLLGNNSRICCCPKPVVTTLQSNALSVEIHGYDCQRHCCVHGYCPHRKRCMTLNKIIKIILKQWTCFAAEYFAIKTLPTRLVLSTWCLMCVVIINSYTGNLTSYLTMPALQPIPNSFQELALSKEISFIVDDSSVLAERVLVRSV